MSVLYIALPVALSIAGLALWAFARAVKRAPAIVARLPHYGLALVKLGRLDDATGGSPHRLDDAGQRRGLVAR